MTVRPSENDRMKCVQTSLLVNGSPVGPPLDAVQSISQVDPRKEWVGGAERSVRGAEFVDAVEKGDARGSWVKYSCGGG